MDIGSYLIYLGVLHGSLLYAQHNDSVFYDGEYYRVTPLRSHFDAYWRLDKSLSDGKLANIYNDSMDIAAIFTLKDGRLQGEVIKFLEDGSIFFIGQYNENGEPHGKSDYHYPDGKTCYEYYDNGKQLATFIIKNEKVYYYYNGKIMSARRFERKLKLPPTLVQIKAG